MSRLPLVVFRNNDGQACKNDCKFPTFKNVILFLLPLNIADSSAYVKVMIEVFPNSIKWPFLLTCCYPTRWRPRPLGPASPRSSCWSGAADRSSGAARRRWSVSISASTGTGIGSSR